jgi:hypothetical protein
MKERPLIFTGHSVRSILAGVKTQTRRIMNPQPDHLQHHEHRRRVVYEGEHRMWCWRNLVLENIWDFPGNEDRKRLAQACPHGGIGDHLWARETFLHEEATYCYEASTSIPCVPAHTTYSADLTGPVKGCGFTPPIFMPRHLSRITLEITEVRVERLQEISEEDAQAEGCEPWRFGPEQTMTSGERGAASPYRGGYACLWDDINGDRASWKSNPFVWNDRIQGFAVKSNVERTSARAMRAPLRGRLRKPQTRRRDGRSKKRLERTRN